MKRRDALVLGGFAAIAGGWQVFGVRKPSLTFSPIKGAPGWEFASLGDISGGAGVDFVTIGLDTGPPPLDAKDMAGVVHRDGAAGAVPVAVFSDFFCPYCRGLIGRLSARTAAPRISITWHELPLLGPNSVLAAKAAEAAALQGGYRAFYDGLIKAGFRPTQRWMGQVAQDAGLDKDQFDQDFNGPDVDARLRDSARAAARLGFIGTPGMAIGTQAILGALDRDDMETLFQAARPAT